MIVALTGIYGVYSQVSPSNEARDAVKEVSVSHISEVPEYDGEHQTIQLNNNQQRSFFDEGNMDAVF